MRLGISSYTYTWAVGVPGYLPETPLDAFALLERAGRLGVDVLQIADNLPLHSLTARQLASLAERAAGMGIQLEAGTRGISLDWLRAYLGIAQSLRSPILRVVVDTAQHQPAPDEVAATLRAVMPAFADAGVCLAIENHDRFRAAQLASIISEVASPYAGVCLDTVNSFGALEGPDVVLATLGRLVVNLHVKDFVVRRADHNMGFTVCGCPAGQGMLDIPWLIAGLREHGRDPNAIIELWTAPEAELPATVAKEAQWAEQSVNYLRTLIPAGRQ